MWCMFIWTKDYILITLCHVIIELKLIGVWKWNIRLKWVNSIKTNILINRSSHQKCSIEKAVLELLFWKTSANGCFCVKQKSVNLFVEQVDLLVTGFCRTETLALNRLSLTATEPDHKVSPYSDWLQDLLIASKYLFSVLIRKIVKQKQFFFQPVFDSMM